MSNVVNMFAKANTVVAVNQDVVETIVSDHMKKAFTIKEEPIYLGNGSQVPSRKALYVDDKCVNIVADSYKVVQPKEVISTFEKTSGLNIDKVLTNPNTGAILIKSRMDNPYINGEEHTIDLTFYCGHDSKYRTLLSMQALRVACMNQMPAISANKGLWLMSEKHYRAFDLEKMRNLVEGLPLMITNFKAQYAALDDIQLSKKQFLELFVEHYKATDKQIDKMKEVYSFATGQREIKHETAYKAYNAVTYQLTHGGRKGVNGLEKNNIKNMNEAHSFFNVLTSLAA